MNISSNLYSNKCSIVSKAEQGFGYLSRITLKQPGWELILRCSMEILASLPTCSPQYVQVDDSEPLGKCSNHDKLVCPRTSSSNATAALSVKITCDPFNPVRGNLIRLNNLMSPLSLLLMSRLCGSSAPLLTHT